MLKKNAIDIVYTWVNGADPQYQKLYRQYGQTKSDRNPERYRDVYSMLKYNLRSLEQFAPWIRDIYLLTCRPQIPDWLNVDHPRIHIVHHDEIFDEHYLPTFSSNVIETFLHKVPNPSNYLLYACDDWLFGGETTQHDFLTEDGRIKVYGTFFGERLNYRVYDGKFDIMSLGFLEHMPWLIYKPFWRDMLATRPEELHRTRQNKFRKSSDLRMDKLYKYYLLSKKRRHTVVVSVFELLSCHCFHKIKNDYSEQKKRLDRLINKKPKFYCLNDDQRHNPNEAVIQLVQDFLEAYYPSKSQYER